MPHFAPSFVSERALAREQRRQHVNGTCPPEDVAIPGDPIVGRECESGRVPAVNSRDGEHGSNDDVVRLWPQPQCGGHGECPHG